MKNEFTPAPGWLAEDVARAKQATASKRDTYPQWGWWGAMIAATDELATLRAEVARLREALDRAAVVAEGASTCPIFRDEKWVTQPDAVARRCAAAIRALKEPTP
jgi:hypothetical protein